MKTKEKLSKLTYLLLFGLISICMSCSTEDDGLNLKTEISGQLENIPEEILVIGQYHNEGLEFAFQSIKSNYSVATRSGEKINFTKEMFVEIGKQAVYDFCEQNQYFGCDYAFHQDILENYADDNHHLTRSDNSTPIYSTDLQLFVGELEKSIYQVKCEDLEKLKLDIDALTSKAQQTLSGTELTAFYAGATTAYASMEYWTKNFQKWKIALNYPELLDEYSDEELNSLKLENGKLISPVKTRSWWSNVKDDVTNWWNNGGGKEVVASDAGGAVAGAMAGGVGAVPGSISGGIGGGTMTSISEVIERWILN